MGISQEELQRIFRRTELENRSARRQRLLQELSSLRLRMKNEGMLLDEILSDEDKAAHKAAVESITAQTEIYEKETVPGYWRRLWRALWNR